MKKVFKRGNYLQKYVIWYKHIKVILWHENCQHISFLFITLPAEMFGEWFLTVSNWVPSILTRGWSISYNNFFWTNHDNYGHSDERCVLLPPLSLRLLCLSTEQWAIGLKEEAPNCQASFLRHKPLKTFWGKNTYWRMKTFILVLFGILALVNAAPQLGKRPPPQKRYLIQNWYVKAPLPRVSAQGVESLWADCRFIPADWGS